jgi:hypothetical protein
VKAARRPTFLSFGGKTVRTAGLLDVLKRSEISKEM